MKPKLFAPPHIVRLFLADEEKLKTLPGKSDSEKIRYAVHLYFKNI
jgi:hypothetical protein